MKKSLFRIGTAIVLMLALAVPMLFAAIEAEAAPRANLPTASGVNVQANPRAEIDYSNARDGYVMVRWLDPTATDVRVTIDGPAGIPYQYRINLAGRWEVLPLTCGNGDYTIRVLSRVVGGANDGRFAAVLTLNTNVRLVDEFAPFLRPNQFVNFNANSSVVALAEEIMDEDRPMLENVAAVYNWVVDNIEYDFELARTVQSGYVPDLEHVLEVRRGICFDYASLMTAMLRSHGIPTRLVIGFVGDVHHAWISVFSEQTGWVNNIIQFDGKTWRIMDPTFASTANQSAEVMQFIGTGDNHRQAFVH